MGTKVNQKARILEAASRIVGQAGAAHLTIDAVALEAGLSKGGVLYHFPNKRSMLEGMLHKVLTDVGERTARYRAELGDEASVAIRARMLAEQEQSEQERAMSLALLAAAAEDPGLLDPAREFIRQSFAEIRGAAADEDFAQILLLAVEGLRFLEMLDLLPLSVAQKNRLHRRLQSLALQSPAADTVVAETPIAEIPVGETSP
jgi:AcrR family transcriptional regulator